MRYVTVVFVVGLTNPTPPLLDDRIVEFINSRLEARPEVDDPTPLKVNAGIVFIGNKIMGQGFVLTATARESLLRAGTPSALLPMYITGDDVTSNASVESERYVINFGKMTLDEAARFPAALAVVRDRVKPERDAGGSHPLALHGKKYWWQFGSRVDSLYLSLGRLRRCIVISRTTKHVAVTFSPVDRVFNEQTYVFASDSAGLLAFLQSRPHGWWAGRASTSQGATPRYPGADAFETLPQPPSVDALSELGELLYALRVSYMREQGVGLTIMYNRLTDPSVTEGPVVQLRSLHERIDRAVLEAYGWTELAHSVPPYCPAGTADRQASRGFEDQVIDRLYLLNAERAHEQERLAAGATASKGRGSAKGRGKKAKVAKSSPGQGDLF